MDQTLLITFLIVLLLFTLIFIYLLKFGFPNIIKPQKTELDDIMLSLRIRNFPSYEIVKQFVVENRKHHSKEEFEKILSEKKYPLETIVQVLSEEF